MNIRFRPQPRYRDIWKQTARNYGYTVLDQDVFSIKKIPGGFYAGELTVNFAVLDQLRTSSRKCIIALSDILPHSRHNTHYDLLLDIYAYMVDNSIPQHKLVMLVEGERFAWPEDRFHIIWFSTIQFDYYQAYKEHEAYFRSLHASRTIDYAWVCMQNKARDYRCTVYDMLESVSTGNINLRERGIPLREPIVDMGDPYEAQVAKQVYELSRNFNAGFSIVTEASYGTHQTFISEKTLQCIAVGHPFLIIGEAGCYRYLHSMGFRSFDGIINESHDTLSDAERLSAAIQGNRDLVLEPRNLNKDIYWACQDTAQYNMDYLYNHFGIALFEQYCRDLRETLD